jgi:hypothetical protein
MTEMNNGPETLKGEDWAGEMGAKWLANLAWTSARLTGPH